MAEHSTEEHAQLYGELRAHVLSRFFAWGRYFRANHLSLVNSLGVAHGSGSTADSEHDDLAVGCEDRQLVRPSAYTDAADLNSKNKQLQTRERWRVAKRWRDNPLLYGSQLLVALAVEHHLGRPDALPILTAAIDSLGKLYKFTNIADFAGYIIRWDAVTSDSWATHEVNGKSKPWFPCDFLLDADFQILYCTPFTHPGYVAYNAAQGDNAPGRLESLDLLRYWEPSMDELCGLVLSYDFVHRLVDDTNIRLEIERQVRNLIAYLADSGYLLVRPCGGFAEAGASGALPALEYPFSRVYKRITGEDAPTSKSFERALTKAGLLEKVAPAMDRWGTVGAIAVAAILAGLGLLVAAIIAPVLGGVVAFIGALVGLVSGNSLGRGFGVYQARDAFDVRNAGERREFFGAFLLKLLPSRQRFKWWMDQVWRGGWTQNFPQFLGLTGLDDPDPTVRTAYLSALPSLFQAKRGELGNTGFAAAIAVTLGMSGQQPNLRMYLDDAFESFQNEKGRMPTLQDDDKLNPVFDGLVMERVRNFNPGKEDPLGALEYLACLALSWLTAKRLTDAGTPATSSSLIPFPSTPVNWPEPTVPSEVVAEIPALADSADGRRRPPPMFGAGDVDERPAEPPPPAPPALKIDNYTINVPESSALVDTGIDVMTLDGVTLSASGSIWAGVWGTGTNGPNGWNNVDNDPKFPLPGTNPYCLLYAIGPVGQNPAGKWMKLGTGASFAAVGSLRGRIFLRTNDDSPGNGSGSFTCSTTVRRAS